MLPEDIFYTIASIFFGISIVLFCWLGFYWVKILRNLSKITSDLQKVNSMIREKIEGLETILATLLTLIEKFAKIFSRKKKGQKSKST